MRSAQEKIKSPTEIARFREELRRQNKRVVFTNGCFDLLHPGHVRYLEQARALGDILVVALNDDASIRRLKGPGRPVQSGGDRCEIVAALACVDAVTLFSQDTPRQIIDYLLPDILVKGGDWPLHEIVGRDVVEAHGGQVKTIQFEEGYSTSDIIRRIRQSG